MKVDFTRWSQVVVIGGAVAVFTGCSLKEKIDRTSDNSDILVQNTNKTNDHARKLETNTSETNRRISDLQVHTDSTGRNVRRGVELGLTGELETKRSLRLSAMREARTLELKTIKAGQYFNFLEYQHLYKLGPLDHVTIQRSYVDAALEVLSEVAGMAPEALMARSIELPPEESNMKDLFALALGMSALNYEYVAHQKAIGQEPVSFQQLLERAFLQELESDERAQLPYMKMVVDLAQQMGRQRQMAALYLLQLRLNILAGIVLKGVYNVTGFFDRIGTGIYSLFAGHEPKLPRKLARLTELTGYLKEVNRIRWLLWRINAYDRANSTVFGLLEKLDFEDWDDIVVELKRVSSNPSAVDEDLLDDLESEGFPSRVLGRNKRDVARRWIGAIGAFRKEVARTAELPQEFQKYIRRGNN